MAFNVPINSISPVATPPDWVRPADWIAITDAPGEVQFLVADTGAKAFSIQTSFTRTSGNIYIDWGDGTLDTISTTSSTTTSHVYSTGGTPCSRGYNTWKIRIYVDPTCVITNARHIPNFVETGGSPSYNIGLLEAYFGAGTCSTSGFAGSYFNSNSSVLGNGSFSLLEYVKLPDTVSWTTQFSNLFSNCASLYKIVMPTSASALTTTQFAFNNCSNLLDIVFPSNATGITNFSNTFVGCYNLRTVTFPTSLNSCTNFSTTFSSCNSLKNITFPSINLANNLASTFNACLSLQWVKFTSLPSPVSPSTSVSFSAIFTGCSQLQNVYFPASCSSNAIYNMANSFFNCYNLKSVIFPTNFNASTFATAFQNDNKLTSVIFQSAMPNLVDMGNCFSGCTLLKDITLPTTVGSTISLLGTFTSCVSLNSITIPSGWLISSLANTFQFCYNITSIVLPNNAQNSCNSMASMANSCYKLQTIVMPTSLNIVATLTGTFGLCTQLKSVIFPATMNSVTAANGIFSSCYELTSVTLPTSMSACVNFSNAFQTCYSLETITMPTTVSASLTTYAQLADGCVALKTLTLPTTQTTSVVAINNMINACGNLTTVNQEGKIGSTTATPLVVGTNGSTSSATTQLTSLSFNCPFSRFTFNGSSTTQNFNKLNSLRLLNASAGQYTGISPQIDVSYCDLDIAALNQLFTDLPTVVGKTINITNCTGAAGCTRGIATLKGWTVTG